MAITQFRDDQMKGEVQGPASSTDNALALFDGTTGKLVKDGSITYNPATGALQAVGGDISILADTASTATIDATQIDIDGGAGGVNLTAVIGSVVVTGDNLETNTIGERTAGSGVTIDSVLLKDNTVTLNEGAGDVLSIDSTNINSGTSLTLLAGDDLNLSADASLWVTVSNDNLKTNEIFERTAGSGVTIDSVLLKDGDVDLNGAGDLILDADADTTISATTDDTILFKTGGTTRAQIDSNGLTLSAGSSVNSFGQLAELNSVNNGYWSGTDLSVVNGGTGASTASAALSNLGGIGAATTDTLTNKTIDGDNNTISNVSDASWTNTCAFTAYRSSNQSISGTTFTQIAFNAEQVDIGGDFNTSTGVFTAPVNGYYTFQCTWVSTSSSPSRFLMELRVNGTDRYRLADYDGVATRNINGSMGLSLDASDTVEIYAWISGASNITGGTFATGENVSFFSGQLVTRT